MILLKFRCSFLLSFLPIPKIVLGDDVKAIIKNPNKYLITSVMVLCLLIIFLFFLDKFFDILKSNNSFITLILKFFICILFIMFIVFFFKDFISVFKQ